MLKIWVISGVVLSLGPELKEALPEVSDYGGGSHGRITRLILIERCPTLASGIH